MKINRLSSTEVANAAFLSSTKKREFLLGVQNPKVFWNYQPVIDALPKLLLAESGLFGHLPIGDEAQLFNQIAKSCKSGDSQRNACLAVARAIMTWTKSVGVRGHIVNPEPLRMTVDTLRYCADVAVVIESRLYVISLDPRSSMKLNLSGKEFIKSLIYHTALIGDLSDAKAALLRVPKVGKGERTVAFEVLEGEPRYSIQQILDEVNEIYAIWETILRSRVSGRAEEG